MANENENENENGKNIAWRLRLPFVVVLQGPNGSAMGYRNWKICRSVEPCLIGIGRQRQADTPRERRCYCRRINSRDAEITNGANSCQNSREFTHCDESILAITVEENNAKN